MVRTLLTWILGACLVIAAVTYIGKGNNGQELGQKSGKAVHGTFEGVSAFIDNALGG